VSTSSAALFHTPDEGDSALTQLSAVPISKSAASGTDMIGDIVTASPAVFRDVWWLALP
jgi:hypothetical protein